MALALSQQLEIDQDNTTRMTGPTKTGKKPPRIVEKKANDVKQPTFLLGGDSIYSNYLRGLSALDPTESPSSSSLSTSMFDSILNKSAPTTATSGFISPPITSPTTTTSSSNHVTQVVLDSDISDSDDSKLSDDSDEESNIHRSRQRMTKGVRPIMERRTQDNRVLVQRRVDNWSNRVDPEQNVAELNESMIERMKDRHRTQVKMAALRNQQQYGDEFNYPPHMVPQPYVPAAMMALPPNGVLQHPGLLMDPVQMYYPPPANEENIHQMQPIPLKASVPVPAAFLPNPTHASLAIHYPSKEEEEAASAAVETQRQSVKPIPPQRKSYFGPQPPINTTMPQSNNQSRISGSTTNVSSARLSSTSSTSVGKNNSSTATLERIDDAQEEEERLADSPVPMDTPSPVLQECILFDNAVAAEEGEEADAENSGDEEDRASVGSSSSSRRKKPSRKLRQSQPEAAAAVAVAAAEPTTPPAVEDSSYTNHTVRASRSTPNFKKGKKKSASRSSSRRNSQDMTGSTPSESVTPPPLPHNSPYINYQPDEHLYHVPRSSSQHQLHQQQLQYHQNQQHRQSLRHMKSEPELPRRSPSASSQQAQQQKLYQQQQQLNMEWERMQSYQREQLLKHQQQQQQMPQLAPMYPMYYKSQGGMDKQYQPPYTQPYTQQQYAQPQYTQPPYDPYQGPAYNVSSHSKNKPNYYQQSSR